MARRTVRMWVAGSTAAAALTVGLVAGAPVGAGAAPQQPAKAAATAQVERLGQSTLYTKNVDTMLNFYRDALGFKVEFRLPDTGPALFGTVSKGGVYFLTFATYDIIKDSTGLRHIGRSPKKQNEVVVLTTEVDKVYQQARKAGAKSLMKPKDQPWGERSAYVSDPEGNLVQISTHHEG